MNIPLDQLARLLDFGYTEVEARFLYLVATHSGYFAVRQFLDFARAKSGKRNARLVEKLFSLGHASAQRYTRRSLVYHLCSRQLYGAIGKDHLRNRREHKLTHIKTRLLALDFIFAHPKEDYFETAEAKRRYFVERFKVAESLFSQPEEHPTRIAFTDRFPLCVAYPSPDYMPVVTFTYVDPEHRNLDAYIAHLRTYRPLFRQLPKDFQAEAAPAPVPMQKILFRAITVPGHEAIFGDSTKNWGDGWQIRGCSGAGSPRSSPSKLAQTLQKTANA